MAMYEPIQVLDFDDVTMRERIVAQHLTDLQVMRLCDDDDEIIIILEITKLLTTMQSVDLRSNYSTTAHFLILRLVNQQAACNCNN